MSTRVHRDIDSTCSHNIPFYYAKLNFTFVTYIYITIRETPIKMQWKFVSNVVCLIAKFPFFSVSCNMPFRITEILFPFFYNILFLPFHHCAFLKLFFLFFSLFFGILFIAKNFLILTILPVFHVVELLLNRIAKE